MNELKSSMKNIGVLKWYLKMLQKKN
jgi:hypothetical protein